jgi:hypothetical protein
MDNLLMHVDAAGNEYFSLPHLSIPKRMAERATVLAEFISRSIHMHQQIIHAAMPDNLLARETGERFSPLVPEGYPALCIGKVDAIRQIIQQFAINLILICHIE